MADTMIEFHLDPRSGVAPYLQIVQQVKEALRLGLLDVGDQLPTVREVVADLAINPNTVAKGYRELEASGLVEARPGPGHVHHRHAGRSLGEAPRGAPARSRALARVGRARGPGRGEHPRRDLDDPTGGVRTPSGMTAPLVTHGVGKRYRRRWALRDCTLAIPERAIVGLAGPNGAGKSTLLGLTVGLLAPTEGSVEVLGRDPRLEPEVLAGVGYVARDAPLYQLVHRSRHDRVRARDEPGLGLVDRGRVPDAARPPTTASRRCRRASEARLALAVALGKRPALLLLDEPFARLDPLAAREFLQPADGRRLRARGHGRDRLARDRGHRARLRPHRPPGRRARPARGQRRGADLDAPPADRRGAPARADRRGRRRSSGSGTAAGR